MKKYPKISAPEVVPGKVYLVPNRTKGVHSWRPATVSCTTEPGWLRGFADISIVHSTITGTHGRVEVRFVDDGSSEFIPVFRHTTLKGDSPWMFATGPEHYQPVTLREVPDEWFGDELHKIEAEINSLTVQIGLLEDKRSHLQALQKKVQEHARTS